MVFVLITVFVTSLLIAVGAAGAFTRRLEIISDRWLFSPGLLSLLGALGANIPNYVASWASAISGQVGVGIGIIVETLWDAAAHALRRPRPSSHLPIQSAAGRTDPGRSASSLSRRFCN